MKYDIKKKHYHNRFNDSISYLITNSTFSVAELLISRVILNKCSPGVASDDFLRYEKLRETILEFRDLPEGWDSYNAEIISPVAISIAMNILEYMKHIGFFKNSIALHAFPLRSGGVQFDFDSNTIKAELEVHTDGKLVFLEYNTEAELVNEIKLEAGQIDELKFKLNEVAYA